MNKNNGVRVEAGVGSADREDSAMLAESVQQCVSIRIVLLLDGCVSSFT